MLRLIIHIHTNFYTKALKGQLADPTLVSYTFFMTDTATYLPTAWATGKHGNVGIETGTGTGKDAQNGSDRAAHNKVIVF